MGFTELLLSKSYLHLLPYIMLKSGFNFLANIISDIVGTLQ